MRTYRKKNIVLYGLILSLIMHALVGVVLFFTVKLDAGEKKSRTVIQTTLVRLGEARKKDLLPRKVQAVPTFVTAKREAKKQNKISKLPARPAKIPPKPVRAKKPSVAQRKPIAKRATRRNLPSAGDRLSQITKNWSKKGAKNGSPIGTEIRGRLQQEYQDQVAQAIRDSYELPSILSENERKNLEVMVKIKIGSHGKLLDILVLKPSRAPFFDNAVVKGAKGLGSFGPPPLQLRSKFARIGIQLKFCPLSCSKG